MQTGAVELASRATGPAGAAAARTALAVISGDGRHVAFTATGALHADNADGAPGARDAYVRALDAGTTHMVSVSAAGAEVGGVNDRAAPDIDFNGDAVAFITDAKLSAGDTDDHRRRVRADRHRRAVGDDAVGELHDRPDAAGRHRG